MAGIVIEGIAPELKILGIHQALQFGTGILPAPRGALSLDNAYIPTISSNSFTNFELRNSGLSGFRFVHETSTTDIIGQLKLQSFIGASPTGTDILTFGNDGSINFISPLVINSDLNMNGFKLRNLDTPVLGTDGVNKDYADSLVIGSGIVTLIGAVTGTGSVGSNITTTLTDINVSQITDYITATNTLVADATIAISKLAGYPANTTTYLRGDGSWSNFATDVTTTALTIRLDEFALPTNSVNFNNQKLTSVATPLIGTDGTNKDYVDTLVSTTAITLTGAVTGTGAGTINTTLASILTSQISNFNTSVTAFRLDQFAIPTANLNLNNNRITNSLDPINPQELATKAYVDLAVDNSFGSQVALPFVELDFNWANPSAQTAYIFSHRLNDAFATKTMFEEIVADNAITADRRVWRHVWGIGASVPSPSPFNNYADYALQFLPSSNSGVPQFNVYSISLNTVDGASFNFGVPVAMGGNRLKDLATPIALTDGVNRDYLINSTITLTGAVTGSGNVRSSFATVFSNNQTVTGTTQTFNYSNLLSSSIFNITNTNAGAITSFRAGTTNDTIQLGYDGFNGYSYINVDGASNDRLAFRADGTGFAALLKSGLFGIGTITPTLGKIQVNGGVQNVSLEETALHVRSALNSVKIELQCSAVGGKLYELRSTNAGALDIVDRTAAQVRYTLDTNGNHIFSNTTYGRRVSGMITMQNNATGTTITPANAFIKVAGTTTSSNLNAVLAPVSNRITNNTSIAHIAKVDCSFSASHNGVGGEEITFALYKNGVQLGNTLISTQNANNLQHISILTTVAMSVLGDYIELRCSSPTNGRVITVKHLMMNYTTT